jgi:hypothetical protein
VRLAVFVDSRWGSALAAACGGFSVTIVLGASSVATGGCKPAQPLSEAAARPAMMTNRTRR